MMKEILPEEAAEFIKNGDTVAFSGFSPAGCPKAVPHCLAMRAEEEHKFGHEFKINVLSGASTNDCIDGELTRADAMLSRFPYQTGKDIRNKINDGTIRFCDVHISQFPQYLRDGIWGKIDVAVVEMAEFSESGEGVLTTGVGCTPLFCQLADKIIIEINEYHKSKILGMHDIYDVGGIGDKKLIPILSPMDRIGKINIKLDPKKVIGIVRTNIPDNNFDLSRSSEETNKIGHNVSKFLVNEMLNGRIPSRFLPVQSGVGNVSNAVLQAMNEESKIPCYCMYSEVLQDSVIDGIENGKILFGSACGLSVSNECLDKIYSNYDFFSKRLVLRPIDVTNSPEVINRLGVISINTALEADIFGNVNSTHIMGTDIVNGIGGAADFSRNAYLSIFVCKSSAKSGNLSTIVPLCSHIDTSEHSAKVIITEYGIADLRGKPPAERAHLIIKNCAHPDYRDLLYKFLSFGGKKHEPIDLRKVYDMHLAFQEFGDMRKLNW